MSAVAGQTGKEMSVIWGLRAVVVVGLLIDAVIHLRLAGEYELAFPEGIGGGTLFRVEATLAIVAAVAILAWGRRPTYLLAFLVAASAFGAVLTARYVELPAVGPLPGMYEPVWFLEKSISAVAEVVAALAALLLLLLPSLNRVIAPRQPRADRNVGSLGTEDDKNRSGFRRTGKSGHRAHP